ncbi:hypothetical protein [Nocardia sp. NPDC020380]|uniref:hypothetical protein n=1 Tax=Nocardia sp. NPDC020380 TaxID=3364309 RepID=UPI0037B4C96B
MAVLNVRTDEAMETAIEALAARHGNRTEVVRYALLKAYKDELLRQAEADAERLAADKDDQAEMLAIQRYMGVV